MTATPESPSPADVDVLPRRVGKYTAFDRVGRGGMADILLARMEDEWVGDRLVVLKMLLPELSADPRFVQHIVHEANLGSRLSHGNVVQVFDLGRDEDRLFIAMEYVEGFDLRQLLGGLSKKRVALPFEFAPYVVREILRALDYAHRLRGDDGHVLGLVHRDVSPSNVLISFSGEVKLCDFGIARATAAAPDVEGLRASRVIGKSAYMSPEQARGEEMDARADLFAAGIILWELCAGRRMYRGSEAEMLALASAAEVPELPQCDLPAEDVLRQILARALHRDPAGRYPSAAAMLEDLEHYMARARLLPSPLRLGTFLTDHFAEDILSRRRARELEAAAGAGATRVTLLPPSGAPESVPEEPAQVAAASLLPAAFAPDVPSPRSEPPPVRSEVRSILRRHRPRMRRDLLEIADASTRVSVARVYVIASIVAVFVVLGAALLAR